MEQDATLREEESKLVRILETIDSLGNSKEWQTLKVLLFDELIEKIELKILQEAKNQVINSNKIYVLQGELNLARKYADLHKFSDDLRVTLKAIRQKLNE